MASTIGAAGIDGDLVGVGQVEIVGSAADIVDDDELAGALYCCGVEGEALRDADAGVLGREGTYTSGRCFLGVVDVREAGVGVREDVTVDLFGKVEYLVRKAAGVAGDGEGFDGVLNVAAKIALGVEDGEISSGPIGRNAHHDSIGEVAVGNRPVREGVLRKLVVIVAVAVAGTEAKACNGDKEAADDPGNGLLSP